MIEETFLELSKSLNGNYSNRTTIYRGHQSSSLPVTIHTFHFTYKEILITFIYDLGNSYIAEISCKLIPKRLTPDFEVEKEGHFIMLFRRNKNPWSIQSSNEMFANKIKMIIESSGIEQLANDVAFEPSISGKFIEKEYRIFTRYYLGFDKYEDSILPLIDFYKKLIDAIT